MNFAFSDEQEELRTVVRQFLDAKSPETAVREQMETEGGFDPEVLTRALGRVPEHSVSSGGQLVVRTNNEGIPFVLADPSAQISQDVMRTASELLGRGAPVTGRR